MNAAAETLFAATVELHTELAQLEGTIAECEHERSGCGHIKGRRAALNRRINAAQRLHDTLAKFYDLDVYLQRGTVTDAQSFLIAFPKVDTCFPTGGNCEAWRIDLGDGRDVLLTTQEGAYAPGADSDEVALGLYADDGSTAADFESCSWADAARHVREWSGLAP